MKTLMAHAVNSAFMMVCIMHGGLVGAQTNKELLKQFSEQKELSDHKKQGLVRLFGADLDRGAYVLVDGCDGNGACEIPIAVWLGPRNKPVKDRTTCYTQVPKLFIVPKTIDKVTWKIFPQDDTDLVSFTFRPPDGMPQSPDIGITLRDNIDLGDPTNARAVTWKITDRGATEVVAEIKPDTQQSRRPLKASAYVVYVQYKLKGKPAKNCDAHDPIIMNDGM